MTPDVYVGWRVPWISFALAVALVLTAAPALADEPSVRIEDRDALLVGDPIGVADLRLDQTPAGQGDLGTYKEYTFAIDASQNRLEIDLRYDAGEIASTGPCLKLNDLDLYVEGPGWQRAYPGCDGGSITVLADDVPAGNYTVRVEASQGSTVCLPVAFGACTEPGIAYRFELEAWDAG